MQPSRRAPGRSAKSFRSIACRALALVLSIAPCSAQVTVAELGKLARDRAARHTEGKLLEPFVADLSVEYDANKATLETRFEAIVALGEAVVPELLAHLVPAQNSDAARQLASNCGRLLARFELEEHFGALVELALGQSETARGESIRLLGAVEAPAATTLLLDLLDQPKAETRRLVLDALGRRRAAGAAPKVAAMLASADRSVRLEALGCLAEIGSSAVLEPVRTAYANEKDNKLLPAYIEYFAAAVREHDQVARELLPLLSRERIDWRDTKRLIEALATIAPRDHEPTIRNLGDIIQKGELNELGLQAALTIQALGDKQGITRLRRALDEQLKKPSRRGEAALYELRGQLGIASEDYNEAYTDFVHAAEKAGETATMVQKAVAGMMRCEARRKKVQSLIKLIRESGLSVADIEAIGNYDAVFRDTLQQDKVKAALQALAKPAGGK
ncbi:MAG: HEAT repeat domain-containing protein [Planctomycetota bacterium]|jgi:hypothetical protein